MSLWIEVGAPSEEDIREAREILSRVHDADAAKPSAIKPVEQRKLLSKEKRADRGVRIAVGYIVSTFTVSLYSTLLSQLASLGRLELHAALFAAFKQNQNASSARTLLKKIGVTRMDLDAAIHADELFREYCDKKTRKLKMLAAQNDAGAIAILNDPKICNKRGRWHGDIDEAVSILRGRRAPGLPGVHRNVNTLRQARLLFTTGMRGAERVVYLYDQKYFRLFERAKMLAEE